MEITASAERGLASLARRFYNWAFTYQDNADEEQGPLLDNTTCRTTCCDKLSLLLLVLLLLSTAIGAIYLLIEQGKDTVRNEFTLVPRHQWTQSSCSNISMLPLPVHKIILLATNTSSCSNETDCVEKIRDLQWKHFDKLDRADILYNFIVAGDDRIYEGRGWNCSSGLEHNKTRILSIAFLGREYLDEPPRVKQVKDLAAFLDYAITLKNVSPCYQIAVRHSTSRFLTDVAFQLKLMREKVTC